MNTFQKIIKALAIALAVFIIFSIVSAIVGIIATVAKVRFVADLFTLDESEVTSFSETYDIEQITSLDIESSIAKLEIVSSDKMAVEASDVTNKFSVTLENGELSVKEKMTTNIGINGEISPVIKIYVPEGFIFQIVDIESGVGDTYIEALVADVVEIASGVGDLEADYLEARNKIDIEAGVGKINIKNSILNSLSFEAGVGEYDITTYLTGNSKFECGVGNGNINLSDFSDELSKILVKKGLGKITVDENEYSDNQTYGTGKDLVEIEGGVGNVTVTLN